MTDTGAHVPGRCWQVCPVCKGSGLVSRPPGVAADQVTFFSTSTGPWGCQTCNGETIILTPDAGREATPCEQDCTIKEWPHDRPCEVQQFFDAGRETTVVSRCNAYREDVEKPCTGRLWAAPGDRVAVCDTCRGHCGMGVLPDRWPVSSPAREPSS